MDLLFINDRPGEYPASYYAASAAPAPTRPALEGKLSCDVCVIGGGYTGLSAALHLAQKGYDTILLEAQRVGFGASGRNGGQVGSGQRVDPDDLEGMVGKTRARALWDLAEESKSLVRSLIRDHEIACGYTKGVLHTELRRKNLGHTRAYVEKVQKEYGYQDIAYWDREQVCAALGTRAYQGGSMDWGAGHLHPLNFALGLARACETAGVRIFENSRVTGITKGDPATIATDSAQVSARFVALGANGYLGDLAPQVARRVMPINNFIVATRPLGTDIARTLIRDNVAVADSKFVVNYFRLSEDRRLLFGGGESYGYRFPGNLEERARKPMLEIFPQLSGVEIEYAWGGTLGITMNRMPDFRRIAGNILSASGYSGHGVAMATLGGRLMADAIAGTAEKFDLMADVPGTDFPGGVRLRLPLLALAMTWYSLRDRL